MALDTGLRRSELRCLRRGDLDLVYANGVVSSGFLVVRKSKTKAGTGRVVPFTSRVCGALTIWLARFSGGDENSFVFPQHKVNFGGGVFRGIYSLDLQKPMGSWARAWTRARGLSGLTLRWHDLRHTFITRLCESPSISEETIRSLAGHVSREMLQRYSHVRTAAKESAIRCLEEGMRGEGGTQKWSQSQAGEFGLRQ